MARRAINDRPVKQYDGSYKVEALPASDVDRVIDEAIDLAKELKAEVWVDANEIIVRVVGDSDRSLIIRDWERAQNGYIGKCIGPYPAPKLSAAEQANDACIDSEDQQEF